jgi:hypothetical protein
MTEYSLVYGLAVSSLVLYFSCFSLPSLTGAVIVDIFKYCYFSHFIPLKTKMNLKHTKRARG